MATLIINETFPGATIEQIRTGLVSRGWRNCTTHSEFFGAADDPTVGYVHEANDSDLGRDVWYMKWTAEGELEGKDPGMPDGNATAFQFNLSPSHLTNGITFKMRFKMHNFIYHSVITNNHFGPQYNPLIAYSGATEGSTRAEVWNYYRGATPPAENMCEGGLVVPKRVIWMSYHGHRVQWTCGEEPDGFLEDDVWYDVVWYANPNTGVNRFYWKEFNQTTYNLLPPFSADEPVYGVGSSCSFSIGGYAHGGVGDGGEARVYYAEYAAYAGDAVTDGDIDIGGGSSGTDITGFITTQPTSNTEITSNDSFSMTGQLTTSGIGSWNESADMTFQWDQGTSNWTIISGTGALYTNDTNPITNIQTTTTQSISVISDGTEGTYNVRIYTEEDDSTGYYGTEYQITVSGTTSSGTTSSGVLFEESFEGSTQSYYENRGWYDGPADITTATGTDGWKFEYDNTLEKNVIYAHWIESNGEASPGTIWRYALNSEDTTDGVTAYALCKFHNVFGVSTYHNWNMFGQGYSTWTGPATAGQMLMRIVGQSATGCTNPSTEASVSPINNTLYYTCNGAENYATTSGIFEDDVWYEIAYYLKPSSATGDIKVVWREYGTSEWTEYINATGVQTSTGTGNITQFILIPLGTRWTTDIRHYYSDIKIWSGDAIAAELLPLGATTSGIDIIGFTTTQPTDDVGIEVNDSFSMAGQLTTSGTGNWNESASIYYQWDQGIASWATISATGALYTNDTNPKTTVQTTTEQSITVLSDGTAGVYNIRIYVVEDDTTSYYGTAYQITVSGTTSSGTGSAILTTGDWNEISDIKLNVSGDWQPTGKCYILVNGEWQQFR